MSAYFVAPIPWLDVMRRTVKEIEDDNCLGMAAQLAFYFLLALFPALLFGVALIGFVPVEDAVRELLTALGAVAPQEIIVILRAQVAQIAEGSHGSLLTLGIGGAIWSSSAAMVAIIDALNRAYDVVEWRPWWKRRVVAVSLTVALAVFIIGALTLVLIGPTLASRVADWLGLEPVVALMWALIRWPVMIFFVVLGVDLIYYFAPNKSGRWAWITPGSMLATTLWIISSFAFKLYVTNFSDYTATYGAIGGVIVTMLWFYVSSMAILIGAELNAVVEEAWRRLEDDRRSIAAGH